MYESYWGLHTKPFENTPDPKFFYASSQHQEACARMLYGIRSRKGAGVLTGVFGCGKTIVGQVVLHELNQERYRCALLSNPRVNDLDVLRLITYHLGVAHPPGNKADVLIALEELVTSHAKEGRDTVILLDEAHAIEDPKVFEELRLLLNFQWHDRFLVTLLLFGQPELATMINANKAFEQRVGIKSRLEPMTLGETHDYIYHRLRVAGQEQPEEIFGPETISLLYESTGGIPRRINRLCDICLLAGFGMQVRTIEPGIVADEVQGLAV